MFKKIYNYFRNKIKNRINIAMINRLHRNLFNLLSSPPEIANPIFTKLKFRMINNPHLLEPYSCKLILKYDKIYKLQAEMKEELDAVPGNDGAEVQGLYDEIGNRYKDKSKSIDNTVDKEYEMLLKG